MRAWAASSIRGFGALCALTLLGGTAQAGSRFETGPAQGLKAAAQLDFTIIIPEVIYLGPRASGTAADKPQAQSAETGAPFLVLSNAGTLAFAPTDTALRQTRDTGSSQSAPLPARFYGEYVVAMP